MSERGIGDLLLIASCLVFVFEGLILATMPGAWQRMMVEMSQMPTTRIRAFGIGAMLVGLVGVKLATA